MSRMITSAQNPLVKHWTKLREQKSYRRASSSMLLVGSSLIHEARAHAEIKALLTVEGEQTLHSLDAITYHLTPELMRKVAGVQAFQGMIAEIALPAASELSHCHSLVVCDQVSDPGNLGALMRTALAFGWDGIFLLSGCCDPFNEKALRASRGAPLKLPLREGGWSELKEILKAQQMCCFAADMEGKTCVGLKRPEKAALFFGNEGAGLSREVVELCECVSIPMSGLMESLNVSVAGGILMYLLQPRGVL